MVSEPVQPTPPPEPPSPPGDPEGPKKRRTGIGRWIWRLIAATFGTVVVLLALAIGLFRTLLPLVPDYHQRIEAAASSAIGYPTKFSSIDARWRWRGPELVFENARIKVASERAPVSIESGVVRMALLRSVAERSVVPGGVLLRGFEVEVTRAEDGEVRVFGIPVGTAGAPAPVAAQAAVWPVPDGEFEVRDARIRYSDGRNEMLVPSARLLLEVAGSQLSLAGNITPPAELGRSVRVSLEGNAEAVGGARRWRFFAAGDDLDLGVAARLLGDPLAAQLATLNAGRLDARLSADIVNGELSQASADLVIAAALVAGQRYEKIATRVEWDQLEVGWRVLLRDLNLTGSAAAWPEQDLVISRLIGDDGVSRLRVAADFLLAEDLLPMLSLLPQSPQLDALRRLAPRGRLSDLELAMDPAMPAGDWSLTTRFDDLGWNPEGALPGAGGLRGSFRADQDEGFAQLDSETLSIDAPALFEGPIPIWRLAGLFNWRATARGAELKATSLLLATDDFDFRGEVDVTRDPAGRAVVLAELRTETLNLAHGHRYLPVRRMPEKAVNWLQSAFPEGTARDVRVLLEGAPADWPFEDGEGRFEVDLEVQGLALDYARDWPPGSAIEAQVRFRGAGVNADVSSGSIGRLPLLPSTVSIADLRDSLLVVRGQTRAPLTEIRDYYAASPASLRIRPLLAKFQLVGEGRGNVALDMRLRQWRDFTIDIGLETREARAGFGGWDSELERINGLFRFSREGVTALGVAAHWLGQPVTLSIGPEPMPVSIGAVQELRNGITVSASGEHSLNDLRRYLPVPFGPALTGELRWDSTIRFPPLGFSDQRPIEVGLTSDLAAVAVGLPAPLQKPVGVPAPLAVRARFADASDGGEPVQLDIDYSDVLRSRLALSAESGRWQVSRGVLHFGEPLGTLSERPGIAALGAPGILDADGWRQLFTATPRPAGVAPLLRTADLTCDRLLLLGQSITDARLKIDHNPSEWLFEIESEQISGAAFVPLDPTSQDAVILNLSRLHWQSSQDRSADNDIALDSVPALRLDAVDFRYDEKEFGELRLRAERDEDGMLIRELQARHESFDLDATGSLYSAGEGPSRLRGRVTSTDTDATMKALGSVGGIDSKQAASEFNLEWDGALPGDLLARLDGTVSVRIASGQLMTVDPSAGRVFGLLSVTALPRRLSLDFRDVFQRGLGFDAIEGDFTLRDGNAYTENLILRGPAAQAAIQGRAGLVAQDYDQQASVFASFGSSLPLAGALAGGPAVGAALLLFSEVFKDPLKEVGRVDYSITGSWADPVIARIGGEAPAPREPAPAAAPGVTGEAEPATPGAGVEPDLPLQDDDGEAQQEP